MKNISIQSFDDLLVSVSSVLSVYQELKKTMETEFSTIAGSRALASKLWSLSSTLSEFIFQISEHLRSSVTNYNLRHATVINQKYDSAKAGEIAAKNDPAYIEGKYGSSQQLQNYLDYLIAIKRDIDMAHYLAKVCYEKESEMYLMTYRNK